MHFTRWAIAPVLCLAINLLSAQNISVFTSVAPEGQTPALVLPPTHNFQVLAQFGDSLSDGSTLKTSPDFSAFVPRFDRNDLGYLSLNHEIGNLEGAVTVFDLEFDKVNQLWEIGNGAPIDFSGANGLNRPCSGGITPWGTVISGEEAILTSDVDSNGYYDSGWLVESRPSDRQFLRKLWRAGNAIHENCAVAPDQKTMYWGADDLYNGFIFKYVATQKRLLGAGKLFVLVRDDSTATTGTWIQVPNQTPEQCNNTNAFCQQVGAWNFAGIEDVEIGPYGKIYFSAKFSGRVWRFKDKGPVVSELNVFVENVQYPIETSNGVVWTQWGVGADNLAFDNANNLWVLQDGGNNYIWMVKPTHTPANPKISLFANTPAGCEPTGITFTPNKRYMFLSFQHPYTTNADTMTDVTGKQVVFNRGTTIVIARKEFLGESILDCPEVPFLQKNGIAQCSISPNPAANGRVILSLDTFDLDKSVEITIFDPLGAMCHHSKYCSDGTQVTLDFQPKSIGAYTISFRTATSRGAAVLVIH